MSAVFLIILNLSITASWMILAVVLVRFLLKKATKWISCVLWALVAIRLICPFSLESALSLIPSSETIPSNIEMMQKPAIDSGITVINEMVNPVISNSFTPDPLTSANPLQIIIPVLSIVWIVGMAAMLLYAFISYIKLKKSVGASVPVKDNIFACDEVKSPFILGIIKPLIYVPSSMEGETLDFVITHESAHIQRRDHWWKPLGFLLLTIYWFNPLCWLAYVLLCRDIEMACDEKVIREMDKGSVAEYSQALLDCSFPRRRIAACPLAFGEVGVKERIKSMLNYKKPAFWIIVVAVVACIVVAVCFLTNPKDTAIGKPVFETENIAHVTFYGSSPNSAETEVPSEYLAEITEWLGTFVAGKKADDVLPPGTDSLFVRIEYADGSIIENSMSTTIVDGTTYIINYDKEPQCYFELFNASVASVGGVDSPESVTVNIRTDVCELYLEVLEDLWNVDPGLNGGISQIGIDLSELTHLNEAEKEKVMQEFAAKHNLPYITGTWEELCEQGYIDKDNLYWEDGLFFSIKTNEDAVWNLPAIKEGDSVPELTAFDAQKWRSGLGAYFFGQCTAQRNADGTWSYTVGQEAIS